MSRFAVGGYLALPGGNGCPSSVQTFGARLPLTSACAVIGVLADAHVGFPDWRTGQKHVNECDDENVSQIAAIHAFWTEKRMRLHEGCIWLLTKVIDYNSSPAPPPLIDSELPEPASPYVPHELVNAVDIGTTISRRFNPARCTRVVREVRADDCQLRQY